GRGGPPSDLRTGTLRANMWPRLSIVAGLLTGIAAAALVLGGILLLAPKPGAAPTPAAQPSGSASASPSAAVSPSAAASASGSAGSVAAFHVGEPAPALVVPQVGGGEIDLAKL